jgi:hypothetical protein
VIDPTNLLEAEFVAVEIERRVEVAHTYHCMQIPHDLFSSRITRT